MKLFFIIILWCATVTHAIAGEIVNVYVWSNLIPAKVVQQFEAETGIKVNISTYDNNETLYAKMKASKHSLYDVIEPSGYFIERMHRTDLLEKLDKSQLPNLHYIDPLLLNQPYDLENNYSVPFVWGVTGIFVNTKYHAADKIQDWSDLWRSEYHHQLLLLDDLREAFSISLLSLGYSLNDTDPAHLKQAYLKLKELMPNIKLFASDAVQSIIIDEDATLGVAWNVDIAKAQRENPHIKFIYPKSNFIIWTDCLAIPKNAPNLKNAYRFINFLMRPDIAKEVAITEGYTITNLAARKLLPKEMQQDPTRYPPLSILKRGQFQRDIPDDALTLYSRYWTLLKLT